MQKKKIDDSTGEVNYLSDENLAVAKREITELNLFEPLFEARETYLAAKEQFEIMDYKFRKMVFPILEQYSVKDLKSDELTIYYSNGYLSETWDDEKVEKLILENNKDISDFKVSKWHDGNYRIKYKGNK